VGRPRTRSSDDPTVEPRRSLRLVPAWSPIPPRDRHMGGMKVSLHFLGKINMAIPLVSRKRCLRREDAG
jgi:hypothetical protein